VPDAPVAADFHQALNVHGYLAAEITFDLVILINEFSQTADFIFSQITNPGIGINPRLGQHRGSPAAANAINIAERYFNPLFPRQVDSRYPRQTFAPPLKYLLAGKNS